ncbi:hypothetical protein HDV00_005776 [Rhizophlyctis rosea]|nr:hypothetical protein HDV00_005776 [Rhizophlyctis rosea]
MTALPTIVFGSGTFMAGDVEEAKQFLDLCEKLGIKHIDTARIYGEAENVLGQLQADKKFVIDTKVPGFGSRQTKDAVFAAQKTSWELLKTDTVDIYYLHSPDTETPFEETLAAINDLYKQGKFKRFGLSNFTAQQVEEVHRIASSKGYVLPTVFQGNYNPISRHIETDLFPTLRKLNIAFYVYSPIAGGFLSKSVEQIKAGGEGRWDPNTFIGQLYHKLYNKPKVLEGLEEWSAISEESGIPRAELAYRYIAYHSAVDASKGDAIIVGASKLEQLQQTVDGLKKGPLPKEIVARVEKVWELVKDEAPVNNLAAA